VEARITKNTAECTADDKVTVSEDFANSCFSSVDMILNDMHIYRGNNLWPYQSHLKDLLTQGSSQKDSELSAGFWYADTVQDSFTAAQNSGYSARLKLTAKSKTFDFIKKINIPLLEQQRPLAPYTDYYATNKFSCILSSRSCFYGSQGFLQGKYYQMCTEHSKTSST
jgi:hypothetical protein